MKYLSGVIVFLLLSMSNLSADSRFGEPYIPPTDPYYLPYITPHSDSLILDSTIVVNANIIPILSQDIELPYSRQVSVNRQNITSPALSTFPKTFPVSRLAFIYYILYTLFLSY